MIATTSSAEKAERLKKLGAHHVINYKEDANWGETAKKLTPGGRGVDHVIEVGGAATAEQSLKAIRYEGIISIIGFLGGARGFPGLIDCLTNICTARGVYVGSRELMEDMVRAVEVNDIRPVVDQNVFAFDKAREAYDYQVSDILFNVHYEGDAGPLFSASANGSRVQWAKKHFGKVVIKID